MFSDILSLNYEESDRKLYTCFNFYTYNAQLIGFPQNTRLSCETVLRFSTK